MEYLRSERNYSLATMESYAKDLSSFQEFLEEQNPYASWTAVQADDVREWVIYLLDGQKLAASSVNRKLSALRTFYKYLRKMGRVSSNPMEKVVAPKKKRPLPYFVRESEMDRLLELTAEDRSFKGIRDRLILMMFYETGVRRAELLGMTDASVDLLTRQVKVTGKRNKQRIIPFGEELAQALTGYVSLRDDTVEKQSDALFVNNKGRRIGRCQVQNLVRRRLSEVTTLKKRSPHVLRHSFATAMLNNGAGLESVKKLLGHASLETTEVYTHTTFEQLKRVYNEAHPRA